MAGNGDEAARWFAASRRGVMLHDERRAYETWRQDPANAAAMEELQDIWTELEGVRSHNSDIGEVAGASPISRRITVAQSAFVATMFAAMLIGVGALPTSDRSDAWTALDWWSR